MTWISGPNEITISNPPQGISNDSGPYEYAGHLYIRDASNANHSIYKGDSPQGLTPSWSSFPLEPGGVDANTLLDSCVDPLNSNRLYLATFSQNDFGGGFSGTSIQIWYFDMNNQTYTFVATTPVSNIDNTSNTGDPYVVPMSDGTIVLVYPSYTATSAPNFVRALRWNGSTWSGPIQIHAAVGSHNLTFPVGVIANGTDVIIVSAEVKSTTFPTYYCILHFDDSTSTEAQITATGLYSEAQLGHFGLHVRGPVITISGSEVFICVENFISGGTVLESSVLRGSPISSPSWTLDAASINGAPFTGGAATLTFKTGVNFVYLTGDLWGVWNIPTGTAPNVTADVMYGSKYLGSGSWASKVKGVNYVDNPPPSPANAYPNQYAHLLTNCHGLSDGTVGQNCDFLISGICVTYYTNFSLVGPSPPKPVGDQYLKPSWI